MASLHTTRLQPIRLQQPLRCGSLARCCAKSQRQSRATNSERSQGFDASAHSGKAVSLLTAGAILASASSASAIELDAFAATPSQVTEGFVQGLLLIFFSELGDKTFFIALLLASQRPKLLVFAGTFGALAIMTVISVALGQLMHELDDLIPNAGNVPWDDVIAVLLLVVFGVQTILNAKDAEENAAEEKEEAAEEVATLTKQSAGLILSTFLLVFAAEWGDKSFLATIALAAATSPVGVTAGAVTGHGAATALAVLGGGVLSKNVSESTLQYGGGFLFLAFAAVSTIDILTKVL
eukprot:jgi/Ulvmu1/12583/UM092_0013.1